MGAQQSRQILAAHIQDWDDYESAAKLLYYVNHRDDVAATLTFSIEDYERLNRDGNGFRPEHLGLRFLNTRSLCGNLDSALNAWERLHQNNFPRGHVEPIPSEIAQQLIADEVNLKNMILLRDTMVVKSIERTYHLRETGCLRGLKIHWSLAHFSRYNTPRHYTPIGVVIKGIQYRDYPTLEMCLPFFQPLGWNILGAGFATRDSNMIEWVSDQLDITLLNPVDMNSLAQVGAKYDVLNIIHAIEATGVQLNLEKVLERAIEGVSMRTLKDLLPRTQISLQTVIKWLYTKIPPQGENYHHIFGEHVYPWDEFYTYMVTFILNHIAVTYADIELLYVTIDRVRTMGAYKDTYLRRIVNSPLFIQGLRNDPQQNLFRWHSHKILQQSDHPFELLNLESLQHVSDPIHINYILYEIVTPTFSSNLIVETIVSYLNRPYEHEYTGVFIPVLMYKPQIKGPELEFIINRTRKGHTRSTLHPLVDKLLEDHPALLEVDPNVIVPRLDRMSHLKFEEYMVRPEITSATLQILLDHPEYKEALWRAEYILRRTDLDPEIASKFFLRTCDLSNSTNRLQLGPHECERVFNLMRPHLSVECIRDAADKLIPNRWWHKTLVAYLQSIT